MTRTKTWVALLVALAFVVGQISFAQAAPLRQTSTATVTIISVTPNINTTDLTTVESYTVVYEDSSGTQYTVDLTIAQAQSWGLLQVDPTTGELILDVNGQPQLVAVLPTTVVVDASTVSPCVLPDGASQPVGEALSGFFCGSQGVSYDTIMGWQTTYNGFGVIAQALFMAQALGITDPAMVEAILLAKQSKDYSALYALGVPDTITNWGQLKKYVMSEEVKSMTNLGAVMSGRATPPTTTTTTTTTTTNSPTAPGNGNGKAKGQNGGGNGNNGNGNGNGNNGNGNANGKNKGN